MGDPVSDGFEKQSRARVFSLAGLVLYHASHFLRTLIPGQEESGGRLYFLC